jgi:hypothetical protein
MRVLAVNMQRNLCMCNFYKLLYDNYHLLESCSLLRLALYVCLNASGWLASGTQHVPTAYCAD